MNTLASWIDAEEVAGAAREVAARGLAAEFAALMEDSTGAQGAVKFDDFQAADLPIPPPNRPEEDVGRVREMLEEIKRKAANSGLLREKGAAPPPSAAPVDQDAVLSRRGIPYFMPPVGPLGTRIRAFSDWLKRQITAHSFFITDAQGCSVTDTEPAPDILAAALLLSEASRRAARHVPSAVEGALHLDLENGRKLCVIHAETSYGHFCLGLVCADPLPPVTADRLRRALKRTIETEPPPPAPVRIERW